MTREEAIKRWKDIAMVVFLAEERISRAWHEELKAATSLPKDEQYKLVCDYCEAIAIEIVNGTSDEQLKQMK